MSYPAADRRLVLPMALVAARARRWAIEGPDGPVALDGVGLTAAARHGWDLVPLPPAPAAEPPEVRAGAGRPVRLPSALQLASACLCGGVLAAASMVDVDGDFTFVGSGHFSGTLLPPALAILALLALMGLALQRGLRS
jgi:hypothetical protein